MERTNEELLDLFADILEPAAEILTDDEVSAVYQKRRLSGIKLAIKKHHRAVIEIMALVEGVSPEEYKVDLLALPVKIMAFLNRPEMNELFTLRDQQIASVSGGPATESIEENGR